MMMPMEGEMLDAAYEGLSAIETKQLVVYAPAISAVAMEFAFAEVADAADVETVQNIFQARIDAQVDGGAWYPATIEQWEKNSEIVTIDNYVCLFVCSDKDVLIEAFRSGSDVPAWAIAENGGDGEEDMDVDLPEEIIAEPSAEPSEAPSEKPSASPAPTPTPKPTPTPTPKPSPTPTPTPTPEPDPTPDDQTSVVESVWADISALGLPAMWDMDAASLAETYGISSDDLEDFICRTPMMSPHATEFFIAKVKDGSMDTVKAAVQERQSYLDRQWSTYLPAQYELVQNYKLVTNGNYILFAVSEHADKAVEIFTSYTK